MVLKFDFIQVISIIAITVVLLVGISCVLTKKKILPAKKIGSIEIKVRTINKILFIIGGLPLLVYPFVLAANAMGLSSLLEFGAESSIEGFLAILFMVLTSSYLLTYILCLVFYRKKRDKSVIISIIPLIHFLLIIIAVWMWSI